MATVTRRITYAWRTFSEHYTINCERCGRPLTRTVSNGCNELADREYIDNLVSKLKADAERLSKTEKDTCIRCRRGRLTPVGAFAPMPSEEIGNASALYAEAKDAATRLQECTRALYATYKGRVVLHDGCEWAIDDIFGDLWWEKGVAVRLRRVNKRQPWLLTDTEVTISLSSLDLAVSSQTIADRQREAEGEHDNEVRP